MPVAKNRPKVVISANGWHQNEAFKLYAANCMNSGSVLVAAQHGGAYGTCLLQPQESHDVKSTYAFFTWGWQYESSHRPLPSINLSRRALAPSGQLNTSASWLMVTNIVPRYVHRFESVPMAHQFGDYMDWQLRFISELGSLRDRLTIRVHPDDFGQGVKERIRDANHGIRFDTTPRPADALANARLVIIDHPVTTMLEALVKNKPTILFWEPKWWEERPEARFLFTMLRQEGVLFDSPEAAAEAARAIATREEHWWSKPGIQRARQLALRSYARTSPKWVGAWLREILGLATMTEHPEDPRNN